MRPGPSARAFRWFCQRPHVRGKSRIEALLEPWIPLPPPPEPLEFPEGFRMLIEPSSRFERGMYFRNADPDTAAFIRGFLRPGMAFVDCGANIGYYTVLAASLVGREGAVYAFEPTPSTFARLGRNVELSGAANVQAFANALGAERDRARVYEIVAGKHEMNSLRPAGPESRDLGGCRVVVLDDLVASGTLRVPHLIKIDAEGAELAVLRGAEALLRGEASPTLIVELSRAITTRRFGYDPEDIVGYLRSIRPYAIDWPFLGRPHRLEPGGELPHYAVFGPEHGGNYVFTPLP